MDESQRMWMRMQQHISNPLTPKEMSFISIDKFDPVFLSNLVLNNNNEVATPSFDVTNPPENILLPSIIFNKRFTFYYSNNGSRYYRGIVRIKESYKIFKFRKTSITNCGITLIHGFHLPMFKPEFLPFFNELVKKAQSDYPHIMTTHNHKYKHWFKDWEDVFNFKNPNSGNRVSIYIK